MTNPVIPPGSVRFVIGQNPNKQIIVVEKEIVCKSPYFRKRLEPHRKAIEGNCPICQEALEEGVNEITYCASTCGNNFHQACIDAWKQSKPAGDTLQCPMCRQAFDIEGTYSIPELTPRGFRNFLDWLELNTVPPWDHSFYRAGRDSQDYIELIEAYFLGCFVKEHEFCKAAMQHLLKICWTHRSYPKWDVVDAAYNTTSAQSPLRELLVDVYMQLDNVAYEWVFQNWDEYPRAFQLDLTKALMQKNGVTNQ